MKIQNESDLDINSIEDLKSKVKCDLHPTARLDLRINETFKTVSMICTHPDHKKPVGPKLSLTYEDLVKINNKKLELIKDNN